MKPTFITASLFSAALVAGSPAKLSLRQENGVPDGLTIQPMVFTGRIELNGPNVTLSGDAQSIYDQIMKANPNYDPADFPEYREHQAASEAARAKRQAGTLSKRDRVVCGEHGQYVAQSDLACIPQIQMLDRINGVCQVQAHSCIRTACGDGCGIWLCNDNSIPIGIWCGNIAGDAREIMFECTERDDLGIVSKLHGRVWRDLAPKWNVQVSRC